MDQIDGQSIEEPREVETLIRQTYRRLAEGTDRLVMLAQLRAALPPELDRDKVDAALANLSDHADVHMSPRTEQRHASPEDQAAALYIGGTHDHQVSIEHTPDPERVAERLHMRDEGRAASMVAALSDQKVLDVARAMNVPASPDIQQVRADLVGPALG